MVVEVTHDGDVVGRRAVELDFVNDLPGRFFGVLGREVVRVAEVVDGRAVAVGEVCEALPAVGVAALVVMFVCGSGKTIRLSPSQSVATHKREKIENSTSPIRPRW